MAIQIILPALSSTHKHFLNEKPKHQKKKKKFHQAKHLNSFNGFSILTFFSFFFNFFFFFCNLLRSKTFMNGFGC